MIGLSTTGSISLGWALVAGRKRVPRPAAGNTALRTFMGMGRVSGVRSWCQVVCIKSFGPGFSERIIVNGCVRSERFQKRLIAEVAENDRRERRETLTSEF